MTPIPDRRTSRGCLGVYCHERCEVYLVPVDGKVVGEIGLCEPNITAGQLRLSLSVASL